MTSPGRVLLTAALALEITNGVQSFLMPIGFTSLQQQLPVRHRRKSDGGIGFRGALSRNSRLSSHYFNDDDQWGDHLDPVQDQQDSYEYYSPQQEPYDFYPPQQEFHEFHSSQQHESYDFYREWDPQPDEIRQSMPQGSKRAIVGGAALGTMMAINSAVGIGAGAEPALSDSPEVRAPEVQSSVRLDSTVLRDESHEVTLPYLERQIEEAEEALRQQEFPAPVVASTREEAVIAMPGAAQSRDSQPEATLPYLENPIRTVEETALAFEASVPVAVSAEEEAIRPVASVVDAPTEHPEAALPIPSPVVTNVETKVTESTATMAKATGTQSGVTLPYLEEQIKAAEESAYQSSASVVASVEVTSSKTVAPAAETTATQPSFVRYTKEKIPGWVETGQKVYDSTAPKVVAGGKKAFAEFDRRVTPKIIEKEHELLGDANSVILDQTLSSVAQAGKMVAGMMGKAISMGIEGGVQVVKATPEVIEAGKQMYNTVDQKIMPEVVDTTRKIKTIVDKTVPDVVDAGKHAYDVIMPEMMNAERQVAKTVRSGVDMSMPMVMETQKKVAPVLSSIEHDLLGDEGVQRLETSVAQTAQQGQTAVRNAGRAIPEMASSVKKAADTVVDTGSKVSRAVPLVVESGQRTYQSVDQSVSSAVSTIKDIGSDIDRAAGKTIYAIEENVYRATNVIDKAIPVVLETSRNAAATGAKIAKTVETGGKAVLEDVSGLADDVSVDQTIDSAAKRFAATKPIYRDFTASVNDPNIMGKL
eukprot:CAMPEP_0172370048 /NCGR_PEP_ID=MMETSP1060-20121228/35940_1 /TAXON_ID=37318 /ORGANISM="Pseudo-nitzschia pungens, Strain cf. cingulata" /LENGTH=759 /DNA_ID=CAMNT_0013095191 /DNA_START=25 /DNA_END=2304 /DNA_ORIENTATION=-